ncbi:hypothetical protein TcBrA4_0042180 [Trypanosoma cruzi]|nr:hypothetical protein TcBrA4_0042180 [Trypanosoma cruzi]
MPRTLDPCITTLARQLQCLPHTGQSAGRRIVAGWGPAGGGGVSVRGSLRAYCAASELHQRHVLGKAGCRGRSSYPYLCITPVRRRASAASTPRVRVVSMRVGPSRLPQCSSKLPPELSGTNNMFGQCDHAGDPSVCELCEVGCLLGFRTTNSVPGHAAVANDKLRPCARSSARRAEQECPESTMYRDRCRERTRFWSAVRREREPVKVDTLHGALPVRRMLLNGFLVPGCWAMH